MHVHYRPAAHVLNRLSSVDFVAVVGVTASGKTTIMKKATARELLLHKVLNNTSRAPRPEESNGGDYRFLPKQTMRARIEEGEYVQVAPTVLGDIYATAPEDYATEGVAVLEVLAAAVPTFRSLPFRSMHTIYIVPPSWEEWQHRIGAHHFTPAQLKKRLAEAKQSLEFALHDTQTRFVINDNLQRAVDDFIALALDRSLPQHLQDDQLRAFDIVRNLLAKLR